MSKYSKYDYVRADMDYYKIPERYEPKLREIFAKDENMTFRYDSEEDVCVYSSWMDCDIWRDVNTDEVVPWNSFTGQCVLSTNKGSEAQLMLVPAKSKKTKKYPKIAEPVETLYDKVIPKKPLEVVFSQRT